MLMLRDVAGIVVAVIVLAGITVALRPGSQTVAVMNAGAGGFTGVLRAATAA